MLVLLLKSPKDLVLEAVFVDSVASSLNVGDPNVGKLPTRVACSIGFLARVYPLQYLAGYYHINDGYLVDTKNK